MILRRRNMEYNMSVLLLAMLLLFCGLGNCLSTVEWGNEAIRSADKLSSNVDEILDDLLGYKNLQNYYNTLSFKQRELNGSEMVEKMANNFGRKFFDRNNAVKHLKNIVLDSLSFTSHVEECCKLDTSKMEMDDRFKQPTGQGGCHRISNLANTTFGFMSKNFEEASAQNLLQMPFLRWQYFVSESGITTIYPGIKVDGCATYDGRYRPFYVQTNVPEPKDVVIVIDKSGSMSDFHQGKKLMETAKEAAKTVVSTLNPHDRVAVIGFSDKIVAMGSNNPREACFGEQLARATYQNKETMNQFISEIRDGGSTLYGLALSKAFDFFENTKTIDKRERVILFLSDGKPMDSSAEYIFTVLRERNRKLNNSVILMTYGLGNIDFSVLRAMADQDGSFYDIGGDHSESVKPGLFTQVRDPTNLRQEMASYYTFFSKRTLTTSVNEEIWSLPYVDAWGLGLMMSVTMPVHDSKDNIVGVVATDLPLDDLLSGAVYFRPSELSYIFIIDSFGFVIYHPLFKYPEDGEVKYIDIQAFETDETMADIIKNMKTGGSGSKTFFAERVAPGGSNKLYGTKTYSLETEAHWKQIPHTDFSLCIVLAKGDVEATLQSVQPRDGDDFLYHRLDIIPSDNPCKHYDNYCAMNQSVVSLGPRAFVDTDAYLNDKETEDGINSIKNYMMTGRGGSLITRGIRDSVWSTQEAERFWKANSENELEKYVMWKYVGTSGGIMRWYPGTQLPKDFDPTVRPWYRNSIANKGKTSFTLPYKDAASGEFVVTLAKVIYEAKRNDVRDFLKDEVVAVIGFDIMVPYFQALMKDTFPMCFENDDYRCTLIDSAGFVMHGNDVNHNAVLPEHITQKEPLVAEALINSGIMAHTECMILEETTVQRTYKIQRAEGFSGESSGYCFKYEFVPIPRTNVFMIVRESSSSCRSYQDACTCSGFTSKSRGCVSKSQGCECPCTFLYEDFNTCTNTYGVAGKKTVPKACIPSPKPLMKLGENEYDIQHLQMCTKYSRNNIGGKNPTGDEGSNLGAIIGGCVAGVVLLILLIALYKYKSKKPNVTPRGRFPSAVDTPLPATPKTAVYHTPTYDPTYLQPQPPTAPPYEDQYVNIGSFGGV